MGRGREEHSMILPPGCWCLREDVEHIIAHRSFQLVPRECCHLQGYQEPRGQRGLPVLWQCRAWNSPEEWVRFSQMERQEGLVRWRDASSKHWCLWEGTEWSQARAQGSHGNRGISRPGRESGPGRVEAIREWKATEGFPAEGAADDSSVVGGLGSTAEGDSSPSRPAEALG